MSKVLVIGLGNSMRSDDALGCHAARALEKIYWNEPQVEIRTVFQLTPELAEDIAHRDLVLFLDASAGDMPGLIRQTSLVSASCQGDFAHSFTPSMLLAAAESLYGDPPSATSLTLGGESFEVGDELSRGVAQQLPKVINQARRIIDATLVSGALNSARSG